VFVVLTLVIHFVVVLLFSSLVVLSDLLSETLAATALGFFLGKLVMRNSRRTWVELAWFPLLNIAGTFIGAGASGAGAQSWHIVSLAFAFAVSTFVFWLQKRAAARHVLEARRHSME